MDRYQTFVLESNNVLPDLLSKIISCSDSPQQALKTLLQEAIRLSGSDAAIFIKPYEEKKSFSYIFSPEKLNLHLNRQALETFLISIDNVTDTYWDKETDDTNAKQMFSNTGFINCFKAPLYSKDIKIGTLVLLNLKFYEKREFLTGLMKNIAPVIALIYKTASIQEKTEGLLQEKAKYNSQLEQETRERKKVEEELRRSRDYYLKLFDEFPNPIWRSNTTAKCDYFNKEWLSFTGRTLEQEMGDGWAEGVHPDDLDRCFKIFLENFNNNEPFEMEYRLMHHDHTYHWLLDYGKPFYDLNNKFSGYIGACYDITIRKLAEEALQQANKKIRILSSITRHDILNQINALRLYLELSKEITTESKIFEYLQKEIMITDLIHNQIEFTRYYENIGINKPGWHNVSKIIFLESKNLQQMENIKLNINTNGLEIYSDNLIQKVFYNLMDNSIRHGEHVTKIDLFITEKEDGIVIIYEDNGTGISDSEKPKLFHKGFGKNTGLGLFLSREILSITGISITENGEPGKGVRFEIFIPKGEFRFNKE